MAENIKRRLMGDPAGATLRGLLKHAALALMRRPLLKAALLRDTEVFGKLVQREQSSARWSLATLLHPVHCRSPRAP